MDFDSFTESPWRRGWRDTKSVWTSWPFFVLDAVVGVVVGGLTMWYWGLVIVIFGMMCVWMRATARAPIVQRNEARRRINELEDERIPRISVEPHSGRREYDWQHEHLMWAELEVTNTSSSLTLNDVEVRVVSCLYVQEKQDEPNNYVLLDLHDWNPTCVFWSERDATPSQLSVSISPNATKAALVAFQDNSNGIRSVFNAPTHPIIVGGAKIEIEISSSNSALWKGTFYIECHPNYLGGARATFEFVEWETWMTNHGLANSQIMEIRD